MKRSLWFALQFTLIAALLVVGVAAAQEPTPAGPSADEVNEIAKQLYCPVCENIPLDTCGTLACEQWREQIREKLIEGWTAEEIKEYFAEQYGDRVLAQPPRRGLNWLIYIVPPAALILGAFALYRAMLAWRTPPVEADAESASPGGDEDEYVSRLEEELQKRDD